MAVFSGISRVLGRKKRSVQLPVDVFSEECPVETAEGDPAVEVGGSRASTLWRAALSLAGVRAGAAEPCRAWRLRVDPAAEEEARLWAQVEEGDLTLRARACPACGRLSAAAACAACGAAVPLPVHGKVQRECPAHAEEEDAGAEQPDGPALCVLPEAVDPSVKFAWRRHVLAADRASLVADIFRGLDPHGAGVVGCSAMYNFALNCGYDEGEGKWRGEYEAVCEDFGFNPLVGISRREFVALLNNRHFWGYMGDDDLRDILLGDPDYLSASLGRGDIKWGAQQELVQQALRQAAAPVEQAPAKEDEEGVTDEGDEESEGEEESESGCDEEEEDEEEDEEGDEEGEGEGEAANEGEGRDKAALAEAKKQEALARVAASTLDFAPPVGSLIEVLFDDERWYTARVTESRGVVATAVFLDDEQVEQIDFTEDFVRLAGTSDAGSAADSDSDSGGEDSVSEADDSSDIVSEPDKKEVAAEAAEASTEVAAAVESVEVEASVARASSARGRPDLDVVSEGSPTPCGKGSRCASPSGQSATTAGSPRSGRGDGDESDDGSSLLGQEFDP